MKVRLFTPLPPDEARKRLDEALATARRAVWIGGARRSVTGRVRGGCFNMRAYFMNPWNGRLFTLNGTFVPFKGGTMLDTRYGVHPTWLTVPNVIAMAIFAVMIPVTGTTGLMRFIFVLGTVVGLIAFLGTAGPLLMWRVWRKELLAFLKESVGAELMNERHRDSA